MSQDSVVNHLDSGGSERRWSLRREWSRAFTIMLLLLLATAVATLVGVRGVVDDVEGTGFLLHRESETVATLRADTVALEEAGHTILSNKPADRSGFVRQEQRISVLFDQAAQVFPATNGMRATILKAHQSWQKGLTTYGLWGDQVSALRGDHSVDNPTFGASSDDTRALLDGLGSTSLKALDVGLAHGSDLERVLIATLGGLFLLGLAVTVYFRRRMAKDLFRPVATMHESVLKLQSGDYGSRVQVTRHDELGALAQAFNKMAEALMSSHVALTLRATHDSLTGLANRATLTEHLSASFRSGSERRARQESLLFIDIDDFKDVNDTLGHEGGDALLIQLAARLNACVRGQDLVARLGGDEFAILVMDDEGGAAAVEVADRVLVALGEPFIISGELLGATVSIGVAQRGPQTSDAAELLRQADFAMYMAKGGGKARFHLFDAKMHDEMLERSALRTSLGVAVASGQLRLQYQPIADLRTGQILGVEALLGWQHPTLGLLTPDAFIALAEQSGDLEAIGCWVLDTATRQVAAWRQGMAHCATLWVWVNLSALRLVNTQSLAAIQRVLADPAVQTDKLVLQVSEETLAGDTAGGIECLQALRGLGVRIAIDDFGTALSPAGTLGDVAPPVDILTINVSAVSSHGSGTPSEAALASLLRQASDRSLTVIAERIEDQEQLDVLRRLGCRMGQGFLLAWPATAHALEEMLASGGLLQPEHASEVSGVA